MADKEERIKISYFNGNPCLNCEEQNHCVDYRLKCHLIRDYNKGISKQEAIAVMAKAIFEWQRPGCRGDVPIEDVWNNEQEGYEKSAEVALNALLEGVKK